MPSPPPKADLDPRLRNAIEPKLVAALQSLKVHFGRFLAPSSTRELRGAEATLPKHGPFRDMLARHIDDPPLTEFVIDRLNLALQAQPILMAKREQPLADIPGFGDLDALSTTILDDFSKLPYHHCVSFSFLAEDEEIEEELSLTVGSRATLVQNHKDLSAQFGLVANMETTDNVSRVGILSFFNKSGLAGRSWEGLWL